MERVITAASAVDQEALNDALEEARRLCVSTGVKKLIFVLPSKNVLDGSTLASALGDHVAAGLGKGLVKSAGLELRLESPSTLQGNNGDAGVLVAFADSGMIERVEARGPAFIVVVPESSAHTERWELTRNPRRLAGAAAPPTSPSLSPVVVAALKSLIAGAGLASRRDRATAVDTYRILKGGGFRPDPAAVRVWALANGWSADGAAQLERIFAGKINRPPNESPSWRNDILDVWRKEAGE